MTFWSGNPAAPSFWTALSPFTDTTPRFLRSSTPPAPPVSWTGHTKGAIKRLFGLQSDIVAAFLTLHYRGVDWRLSNTEMWIRNYLRDPDVIALGYFEESDASGRLLGTIFAVPLMVNTDTGTALQTNTGGAVRNAVVVEGLCVHSELRGHGLAGFLLSHIDSFVTRTKGPTAFLYSRELSTKPLFSTALCTDMYAFKKCGGGTAVTARPAQIAWTEFERLWISNAARWCTTTTPCIVSLVPSNVRNDLYIYSQNGLVVVVSNTQRKTHRHEQIYEVQWCGTTDGINILNPIDVTRSLNLKRCLDDIAASLEHGLLFICGALAAAGCDAVSWDGWTYGTSGAHALYIYNYMPPAFGTCRIHMIRSEI